MKNNKMTISKEQIFKMQKASNRLAEIAQGGSINYKNVHTTKKAYNRQNSKKVNFD